MKFHHLVIIIIHHSLLSHSPNECRLSYGQPVLDFLRTTRVGARPGSPEPGGGEGGGRCTVSLSYAFFLSVFTCYLLFPFLLSFAIFPSFLSWDRPGRGQGESPRAAGGLFEGAADGKRERTVYNIVMIQ